MILQVMLGALFGSMIIHISLWVIAVTSCILEYWGYPDLKYKDKIVLVIYLACIIGLGILLVGLELKSNRNTKEECIYDELSKYWWLSVEFFCLMPISYFMLLKVLIVECRNMLQQSTPTHCKHLIIKEEVDEMFFLPWTGKEMLAWEFVFVS